MAKATSVKSLIKDTSTKTSIDQSSLEAIAEDIAKDIINSLIKEFKRMTNKGEEVRIEGLSVFKQRPSKGRRFTSRQYNRRPLKGSPKAKIAFGLSAPVKTPKKKGPLDYGPIRFRLVAPPSYKEIVKKAESDGFSIFSDQKLDQKK